MAFGLRTNRRHAIASNRALYYRASRGNKMMMIDDEVAVNHLKQRPVS